VGFGPTREASNYTTHLFLMDIPELPVCSAVSMYRVGSDFQQFVFQSQHYLAVVMIYDRRVVWVSVQDFLAVIDKDTYMT
jgi:hypothetical protein